MWQHNNESGGSNSSNNDPNSVNPSNYYQQQLNYSQNYTNYSHPPPNYAHQQFYHQLNYSQNYYNYQHQPQNYRFPPPPPPPPPPNYTKNEPMRSQESVNYYQNEPMRSQEYSKYSQNEPMRSQEIVIKEEPIKSEEEKTQPVPVPTVPKAPIMVGKRRGGRILPTGVVKKSKTVPPPSNGKETQYEREMKKYKDASCDNDRSTRPLVK